MYRGYLIRERTAGTDRGPRRLDPQMVQASPTVTGTCCASLSRQATETFASPGRRAETP